MTEPTSPRTRVLWALATSGLVLGIAVPAAQGNGSTSSTGGPNLQYVASAVSSDSDDLVHRDLATGGETLLHAGGFHDAVTWSPDGRRVAFGWSPDESRPMDLYVMDAIPGSPMRQLTNTADADESDPSWSPDGEVLVYTEYVAETITLRAMPSAGGTSTVLPGGEETSRAKWLPDGSAVVAEGREGLLVHISQPGGTRTTIPGTADAYLSALSTQGTHMSFYTGAEKDLTLWTIPVDASAGPTRIATGLSVPTAATDPQQDRLVWVRSSANYDTLESTAWNGSARRTEASTTERVWDLDLRTGQALAAPFRPTGGDWDGDGRADLVARDAAGLLWLYPGQGAGDVGARRQIGVGWKSFTAISTTPDLNGDATDDILGRDSLGRLWLYPGNGDGGFLPRRLIGPGWSSFTAILAPGDFTGDGLNDLIGRDGTGRLWLYGGDGRVGFTAKRQIGSGWTPYPSITTPGDTDGDGKVDLVARDTAGRLWLYPGNGNGGFLPRRQVGSGWSTWTGIWGPGDTNGDGNADLLARDSGGRLWMYPGNGNGGYGIRQAVGVGWTTYTIAR